MEVEYGRCYAVYQPGPVCALWKDREVDVWVKAGAGAVEVRGGGQLLKPKAEEEVKGGRRYRLVIPPQATSLVVSRRLPDGSQGASWSLALKEPEIPGWDQEIRALEAEGKREEARQRLKELRKAAPLYEQGDILRLLAGMARTDANPRKAEIYFTLGIAMDRAAGRLSGEIEKTAWLAGLYLEQGRFSEAWRALESLPSLSMAPGESKYLASYYRGILASRAGDYGSALRQLPQAVTLASKIRLPEYRWKAEQAFATLLQGLGRSEHAAELFERLQKAAPFPPDSCDQGDFLTNWAWTRLLQGEGGEEAEDPTPMLKEAQTVYDRNPFCTSQQRLNARLNLALAHQQASRWREAGQSLEEAHRFAGEMSLRERLWWLDLEGREAVAVGDSARALRLYEELEALARRALSFEGRFRAAFGRARAQVRSGHRPEALQALAEADQLIDVEVWHVPSHEGRDTLVAHREAATKLHLELLLEVGDREAAFALARRARSRLLRQLELRDRLAQLSPGEQARWDQDLARYLAARNVIDGQAAQEWQLAGDQRRSARESRVSQLKQTRDDLDQAMRSLGIGHRENGLAQPGPGEVILGFHPLPNGEWVGFAADERGIGVSRPKGAKDLAPEALASRLLEPFHAALARAEHVRILPYGRLRSVDFHMLSFEGKRLLARSPIVYGLDLPVRRDRVPPGGRRVALLVADPGGNLRAARDEAEMVAGAIRAWRPDWTLKTMDREDAQAGTVLKTLPQAFLFHYAGHGTFAGFAGWDSVLNLADGTNLTLSDLRTLRRAPAWVVLSSCDAGRSSEEAPGEGIGLANAFLLAGSQKVIAATRSVPDETARDLMKELYRGWQPGSDLPRQFQRAQLACLKLHPVGAGCESFRLLEP